MKLETVSIWTCLKTCYVDRQYNILHKMSHQLYCNPLYSSLKLFFLVAVSCLISKESIWICLYYAEGAFHWCEAIMCNPHCTGRLASPGCRQVPYVISQVHDTSLLETQAYFTTYIAHPFLVFVCGFCMFLIASSLPSVLFGNHFADYRYYQHNQEQKWCHILISWKIEGYICEIGLSLWCLEELCKTEEKYGSFISRLKRIALKALTEKSRFFLWTLAKFFFKKTFWFTCRFITLWMTKWLFTSQSPNKSLKMDQTNRTIWIVMMTKTF